jgi:hypothetical protein
VASDALKGGGAAEEGWVAAFTGTPVAIGTVFADIDDGGGCDTTVATGMYVPDDANDDAAAAALGLYTDPDTTGTDEYDFDGEAVTDPPATGTWYTALGSGRYGSTTISSAATGGLGRIPRLAK